MKNKNTTVKNSKKLNIYFTWTELPAYGYSLLKFIYLQLKKKKYPINFKVISTNTSYSLSKKKYYKEDNDFFHSIKWINPDKIYDWYDLGLEYPDIYFQSGWYIKPFKHFGKITKNKNSKVVLCADNPLKKKNIRQFIGKFVFKFLLRNNFDYAWVPASSGRQLMLNCGFRQKQIFTGLLCACTNIYKNHASSKNRKKQFVFVGQLIERKNVKRLIDAFNSITLNKEEWELIIVGSGDLIFNKLQLGNNIKIIKHSLPSKLSTLYRNSHFFILPSMRDHWGLVVHEAALSGCFLLLSDVVGSIHEFANKTNSIIFKPKSVHSIRESFEKAMLLKNKELNDASKESVRLGNIYNYENTYAKFIKIVNKCLNEKNIKT